MEKQLKPDVKYGGVSVILWACFSSRRLWELLSGRSIIHSFKCKDSDHNLDSIS